MRMLGLGSIATLLVSLTATSLAAAGPAPKAKPKTVVHHERAHHSHSAHGRARARAESEKRVERAAEAGQVAGHDASHEIASAKGSVNAKANPLPPLPAARADVPLVRESVPKPNFKPSCLRPAVTFVRGTEEESFSLTRCDGSQAPLAVEKLSIVARAGVAKPQKPVSELAKSKGSLLAPGIKRVDPRLAENMQVVIDHFVKSGKPARVHVVSGFRPGSTGSYHQTGHAIDMHIEGVANEALLDFCKTLTDVGCGYYPNSSFVHMDVREKGAGHVSWIDASGPGESARYVEQWPGSAKKKNKPKFVESIEEALAKIDKPAASPVATAEKAKNDDANDKEADAPAAAMNVPATSDDFDGAR